MKVLQTLARSEETDANMGISIHKAESDRFSGENSKLSIDDKADVIDDDGDYWLDAFSDLTLFPNLRASDDIVDPILRSMFGESKNLSPYDFLFDYTEEELVVVIEGETYVNEAATVKLLEKAKTADTTGRIQKATEL